MPILVVQIVRFVDVHFPGVVECEFTDASGRRHTLRQKVPIVSKEDLWTDSAYPRPGVVECEVLARWTDQSGRELVRITTEKPWGIESVDGLCEFVVPAKVLVESGEHG